MPSDSALEPVIVTAPSSVTFLKSLWEQVGPGRLEWDFSRPGRVSTLDAGSMEVEDGVLKSLKLEEAGLAGKLKIEGVAGLDWLKLKGNQLTAVEFKNMPKLGGFTIVDEHLTVLTLGGGLGRLNYGAEVKAGNLSRLEVKGRNKLSELYIKASRLTDIQPLRRLEDLGVLWVNSDRLIDINPLAGMRIPNLAIESPLLEDLRPLGHLKIKKSSLQELHITGRLITDLSPLVKLRACLFCLDIRSPILTDLRPLARLTKLVILGVFGDAVTDLSPLAKLSRLMDLVLEGQEMRDFSPLAGLEEKLGWKLSTAGNSKAQLTHSETSAQGF